MFDIELRYRQKCPSTMTNCGAAPPTRMCEDVAEHVGPLAGVFTESRDPCAESDRVQLRTADLSNLRRLCDGADTKRTRLRDNPLW